MPKKAAVPNQGQKQNQVLVSKGAGMIAGLEIWVTTGTTTGTTKGTNEGTTTGAKESRSQFILVDQSGDNRFANDVQQWNSAASLNTPSPRKRKDAKKQNATSPSSPHPDA